MATDYDKGEITEREELAADRQKKLSRYDANSVANQLDYQLKTYDLADAQNKALRDLQIKQNRRKAEADRFEAQRQLQNAALGLFSSAGTAMNGSTTGNMLSMLRNRNDADNSTYWQQLQENMDAVNNAYEESYDQNQVSRRDAAVNATKSLRDIQSNLAANLNNINPNLYEAPGTNEDLNQIGTRIADVRKGYTAANAHQPTLSGYIMPSARPEQGIVGNRNTMRSNTYFGKLMNMFNH